MFADILTQWTKGYRNERKLSTERRCSIVSTMEKVVPSPDDIDWPSMDTFRAAQLKAIEKLPDLVLEPDRLFRQQGRIWIPADDQELKLKVLAISHSGMMGHRGKDSTERVVLESYTWHDMNSDISSLVHGCLDCLMKRTGEVVPRPYGHGLHGDAPNEVVHMDYLYMGKSNSDLLYLLLIRDDLSSYVWLWPTTEATSTAAAVAVTTWIAVFGPMKWIVTDQGSHFKNRPMKDLTEELKVDHHLTTAYSPWANGSVERIYREVLRACKAILHEFRLEPKDWPAATECIQSVINQSPLRHLGLRDSPIRVVHRTPLEVFTSHKPTRPLLSALPVEKYSIVPTITEVRARQLIDIEETQSALKGIHRYVQGRASKARERAVAKHNAQTNVQAANFEIGSIGAQKVAYAEAWLAGE